MDEVKRNIRIKWGCYLLAAIEIHYPPSSQDVLILCECESQSQENVKPNHN